MEEELNIEIITNKDGSKSVFIPSRMIPKIIDRFDHNRPIHNIAVNLFKYVPHPPGFEGPEKGFTIPKPPTDAPFEVVLIAIIEEMASYVGMVYQLEEIGDLLEDKTTPPIQPASE